MSLDLANAWWKSQFKESKEVTHSEMIEHLKTRFNGFDKYIPIIVCLLMDADYNFSVKHDEFENFMKKFGKFDTCIQECVKNFFDEKGDLHPWWHGKLERDDANKILGRFKEQSTYLVRFSTRPESFALAYNRVKNGQPEVKNVLIECNGGQYRISGENAAFDSVPDLLKNSEHTKHIAPISQTLAARVQLIRDNNYTREKVESAEKELKDQEEKDKKGNYGSLGNQHAPSGAYGAIGANSAPAGQSGASGAYGAIGANGQAPTNNLPGGAYGAISENNNQAPNVGAYGAITDPK